jgi:hypothetical protein
VNVSAKCGSNFDDGDGSVLISFCMTVGLPPYSIHLQAVCLYYIQYRGWKLDERQDACMMGEAPHRDAKLVKVDDQVLDRLTLACIGYGC